jgi:carbon monoxide dehydrogenase subunit G
MNLSAIDPAHTRMDWTAQVTVSGTIATVGARFLHQTAEKLTKQFFDCLKAKLQTSEEVKP